MPIDQPVQHVPHFIDNFNQKCPVVGEVHFVKADHGERRVSQLRPKLGTNGQLVLVELVVLEEKSNLHCDLDEILDGFVSLFRVEFLLEDTVKDVQQSAKVVVYECFGY